MICSKALMLGMAFTSVLTWSVSATADNPDRLYMSGEAAMTAGAVSADTQDTGSVWYNPAGLARSAALRFDVNVSAYALQLGGKPQLEGLGDGAKSETVSVLNFAAVPTAFASVRKFDKLSVAVGVFVPQMGVTGQRARVYKDPTGDETGNNAGYELVLNDYRTTQELYGGPGFGLSLGRGVDIGMSFFIHYRAILQTQDARVLVQSGEDSALASINRLTDWLQLGLAPTFGTQLQLSKRLRCGILFRMPSVRILNLLGYSESISVAHSAGVEDTTQFKDEVGVESRFLTPARFNLGLSYQLDRTRLAVEGSYQLPFRNDEVGENLRATFNGRVGARFRVRPKWEVGGGVFTNMSTTKELTEMGDSKLNFYGLTLATHSNVPYKVAERDGEKLKAPSNMNFGSTFAFSYSIGIGKTLYGQVNDLSNPTSFYRERPFNVVAHEWVFTVGGTLFED